MWKVFNTHMREGFNLGLIATACYSGIQCIKYVVKQEWRNALSHFLCSVTSVSTANIVYKEEEASEIEVSLFYGILCVVSEAVYNIYNHYYNREEENQHEL